MTTTYTFAPLCDALVELLATNVPDLAVARAHRYVSYDLTGWNVGGLHFSVAPLMAAEKSDWSGTAPIGSVNTVQSFDIAVWEATPEGARAQGDEAQARKFLDIVDEMREVLLNEDYWTMGPAWLLKWESVRFGYSGTVRVAHITVSAQSILA